MKRCMIVPIALIATAGNAQAPGDLKIIKEIVREVQAVLTEEGVIGLKAKSMNYHKLAVGKKDRASLVRCVAFDMQSHMVDSSVAEMMKIDPYPYFTQAKISERWSELFETMNFKNKEEAKQLIQNITKSLQEETAKMLSQ